MVRFLFPAFRSFQESTELPRSRWPLVLFLIPIAVYFLLRSFETELTRQIIPLFPDESDKSFGFYRDFLRLCFNEMLWLSFFLLLAWILFAYIPSERVIKVIDRAVDGKTDAYAAGVIFVSLFCSLYVAYFTLDTFPNSADEYVYLYQAETMSEGSLTNGGPPLEDVFLYSHIAQKDGVSVGRFPPGWPLLLTIPFLLGIPAYWLNPIISALSLLLLYQFAKQHYGQRVAFWSVVSFGFTSLFIFNSASYFSHSACTLMILAFVFFLYKHLHHGRTVDALWAGVFLGLTVITRYFNAVLILLPVIIFLFTKYRWNAIRPLVLMGLGTLPFVAFLYWYNFSITGNGFLPVTVWTDPRERLGFGVMGYTPLKGVEYLIRRVFLFFYWASPALLLLYLWFLIGKLRSRAERVLHPEDYFALMMIVGYFFYHHIGGNQYGPRFWYESMPFLILLVVRKVINAPSPLTVAIFAAGVAFAIVKLPFIMQREHQIVHERTDIYRLSEESGLTNAVVIVSTHTGVIRPMGTMDLTRNGTRFDGDVLFVHDRPAKLAGLIATYPERTFYRYKRHPEKVDGWFEPLNNRP